MLDALRRHWAVYLMEAAGLAFFVISASAVTTLLEYPGSPIHQAISSKVLRRVPLGLLLGLVIAIIVYAPTGKRSGAHINPAVTWAFYRHGKIGFWDAVWYTVAQFGGAILAAQLMNRIIGAPYAHPEVGYVVTKPGPAGVGVAFLAEFVISFILMFAVLVASESKRLEKKLGWIAGALIAAYLILETPLSGMSLNPARSFGSAFLAGKSPALWIYFVSPVLAMLLAVELYRRLEVRAKIADHQPGPNYPMDPAKAEQS